MNTSKFLPGILLFIFLWYLVDHICTGNYLLILIIGNKTNDMFSRVIKSCF